MFKKRRAKVTFEILHICLILEAKVNQVILAPNEMRRPASPNWVWKEQTEPVAGSVTSKVMYRLKKEVSLLLCFSKRLNFKFVPCQKKKDIRE